jgi:hypothetical protein
MYTCLDSLESPLRPPPNEKKKVAEAKRQEEEDVTMEGQEEEGVTMTADDMLSMTAGQSRNIRNLVNRVMEGIMPEKNRPKGDDSESNDDADSLEAHLDTEDGIDSDTDADEKGDIRQNAER